MNVSFSGVDEEDDNSSTTGIINIENSDGLFNGMVTYFGDGVFNLKGQKVSSGSLENLPKGVYIVNGKKVVVE